MISIYNMKKSNYPVRLIVLMTILWMNPSCKKFVEVDSPVSLAENSKVFNDNDGAISAALGVYANMISSNLYLCNGGATIYPALSADELSYNSSDAEILSFQNNSIIANNGTGIYTRLWVPGFRNIYFANAVIEGLTNSTKLNDSVKKQLEGEMLVARAFNYFYLINLFGGVPFITSTDYRVNRIMPRTPPDKIYNQLIGDLLNAKGLLPDEYPSAMKARPNKWTAAALLSRIYLYEEDWVNAEMQASSVINSNEYSLESDIDNVFSQSSNETIWQFANDYRNTGDGATFIPPSSSSRPAYSITAYLLNAFDPGDLRKEKWIKSNIVRGQTFYYPYKYKIRSSTPVSEYYIALRLAEQYLIRAEARAKQGNIDGALEDINIIRVRAGLPDTTASDQSSVLSVILKERQAELFCEWGNRFFDLKRTGDINQILGMIKAPYWQQTDALYPIPLSELQNNPALIQNPGY